MLPLRSGGTSSHYLLEALAELLDRHRAGDAELGLLGLTLEGVPLLLELLELGLETIHPLPAQARIHVAVLEGLEVAVPGGVHLADPSLDHLEAGLEVGPLDAELRVGGADDVGEHVRVGGDLAHPTEDRLLEFVGADVVLAAVALAVGQPSAAGVVVVLDAVLVAAAADHTLAARSAVDVAGEQEVAAVAEPAHRVLAALAEDPLGRVPNAALDDAVVDAVLLDV